DHGAAPHPLVLVLQSVQQRRDRGLAKAPPPPRCRRPAAHAPGGNMQARRPLLQRAAVVGQRGGGGGAAPAGEWRGEEAEREPSDPSLHGTLRSVERFPKRCQSTADADFGTRRTPFREEGIRVALARLAGRSLPVLLPVVLEEGPQPLEIGFRLDLG